MPFINQQQIAASLRAKATKDYKEQLRTALLNPTLTAEQRRDLRVRLAQVGRPKTYDATSSPLPGAIELPSPPQVFPTPALPRHQRHELQGMKKSDLQHLAKQVGLSPEGTRADLIDRLLAV